MIEINVTDFKTSCLRLFERLTQTKEPIIIKKNSVAIAIIKPFSEIHKKRKAGLFKNKTKVLGDVTSPVGEDLWEVLK